MEHEPSKPRHWRKVYLGIDAGTLEIRAIEVTGNRVGEAPMLPELLNKRSRDALSRHGRCGEHDTYGDGGDYAGSCEKGLSVAADAGELTPALAGNCG